MKTHSNGCKLRIAIALSGWTTSPSIRSLIAIAPTIVFKSSSGESTCSELDYEISDALPPSVDVRIQLLIEKAYSLLLTGPSGSADMGGITVHPAQEVMTLTVIFWSRAKTGVRQPSI
jgi:hypothetical protein